MLTLPATPADCLAQVISPALAYLDPPLDSPEARVLLLATALQESGLRTRLQDGGGPAHGLWQTEQGGARCVLDNAVSKKLAADLCSKFAVAPISSDVYWTLAHDDLFACAFARLMLWCDPHPLPELGDADDAWLCYQKNWGPGKPRPQEWPANYAAALAAVQAAP
jgi:hypothetical protein